MEGGRVITTLIVDPLTLPREGLRALLKERQGIEVIGEAADGFEVLTLTKRLSPDVVLLELVLPRKDGIDTTKELVALRNGSKVLAMTLYGTVELAFRVMRAGARGFIPKSCSSGELVEAIRTVYSGKTYLPPGLQQIFAERYFRDEAGHGPGELLSDREFQVTCLLASGCSNHEIAEQLRISVKTVDTHRANLLRKLCLRNNSDLTRFAIRHGFIGCESPLVPSAGTDFF